MPLFAVNLRPRRQLPLSRRSHQPRRGGYPGDPIPLRSDYSAIDRNYQFVCVRRNEPLHFAIDLLTMKKYNVTLPEPLMLP